MSEILSIDRLARQIGLEELATISQEEMEAHFLPAAVTGLSDKDIELWHNPFTGRKAELYGEKSFGTGLVAQNIARTAIANGTSPGPLYDFQVLAAQRFTEPGCPWDPRDTQSAVRISHDFVTIDDNLLGLARAPAFVFDFGAGLNGRIHISDQIKLIEQGRRPFVYSPLSRLPFINQTLGRTYEASYGSEAAEAIKRKKLYLGRENGIAAATDEIVKTLRTRKAMVDIADIVLVTGAQHAALADIQHGIENAFPLLKEGGMLVLRALARPALTELGTDEIAGWAYNAGFPEKNAIHYEPTYDRVGPQEQSGHFGTREMKTVVLTK